MREIKFRGWDKDVGKMYYQDKKLYFIHEYSVVGISFNIEDEDRVYSLSTEGLELMMCTGFKDKNNKDIYQGDIVLASNSLGGRLRGEIKLNPPGFELITKYSAFNIYYLNYPEVIGNIYENPELLERRCLKERGGGGYG